MRGRRGVTLIELLIVVSILGTLAAIALPKFQSAKAHARAAEVVGAMRAVRIAAIIWYDSAGTWPPSASSGTVPVGLGPYLPREGAIFTGTGYKLRWRVTSVVSGGVNTTQGRISAVTTDQLLCPPVAALLGGSSATVTVNCGTGTGRVTQTVDR